MNFYGKNMYDSMILEYTYKPSTTMWRENSSSRLYGIWGLFLRGTGLGFRLNPAISKHFNVYVVMGCL